MTSASELFYGRRSRFARSSIFELGGGGGGGGEHDSSFSSLNRNSNHNKLRRHRHANHHPSTARRDHPRLEIDGCDLPRRPPPHLRHHTLHRPTLPDRESGLLDQDTSPSTSRNGYNPENQSATQNRFMSAGNDRLPGRVLLARERLLQRLRGVSLSANRQSNSVSSSTRFDDLTVEDDIRLAEFGEWENVISREWLAGAVLVNNVLPPEKIKRPPGLTQEAINSLQVEIFYKLDKDDKETKSRALQECSICLDSFLEGDKLICLPCEHKFHCHCLETWVRICGDCPYCRAGIVLTRRRAKDIL